MDRSERENILLFSSRSVKQNYFNGRDFRGFLRCAKVDFQESVPNFDFRRMHIRSGESHRRWIVILKHSSAFDHDVKGAHAASVDFRKVQSDPVTAWWQRQAITGWNHFP